MFTTSPALKTIGQVRQLADCVLPWSITHPPGPVAAVDTPSSHLMTRLRLISRMPLGGLPRRGGASSEDCAPEAGKRGPLAATSRKATYNNYFLSTRSGAGARDLIAGRAVRGRKSGLKSCLRRPGQQVMRTFRALGTLPGRSDWSAGSIDQGWSTSAASVLVLGALSMVLVVGDDGNKPEISLLTSVNGNCSS